MHDDPATVAGLAVLGGVGLDIFKTQINNLISHHRALWGNTFGTGFRELRNWG